MVCFFGDKSGMFVSDNMMPKVRYPWTIQYYLVHLNTNLDEKTLSGKITHRLDPGIRKMRVKAGFHLCECGRADRATVRRQSREPVARLRYQGPEHAY